jgi:hypothetical protein
VPILLQWCGFDWDLPNFELSSRFSKDFAAICAFNGDIDRGLEERHIFSGKRANKIGVVAREHRAMSNQVDHEEISFVESELGMESCNSYATSSAFCALCFATGWMAGLDTM